MGPTFYEIDQFAAEMMDNIDLDANCVGCSSISIAFLEFKDKVEYNFSEMKEEIAELRGEIVKVVREKDEREKMRTTNAF